MIFIPGCGFWHDSLLVTNDTDKSIVVLFTSVDDTIYNKSIYLFSKPSFFDNGVEYPNIREVLKPNESVDYGYHGNYKEQFKKDSSKRWKVFLFDEFSLVQIANDTTLDSNIIQKCLVGSFTINKSFFERYRNKPISCKAMQYKTRKVKQVE